MKRLVVAGIAGLVLALAAGGVYYYSGSRVARQAAVTIAAGEDRALAAETRLSLGSAVPHDRLRVRTIPMWSGLSRSPGFSFVVQDRSTLRYVKLLLSVRLTSRGWQLNGFGEDERSD